MNLILLYHPALVKSLRELGIKHPGEAALLISQAHFWMGTENGHITRDGRKWIYNAYADWSDQIPSLSAWQIGLVVRQLREFKLLETSCFAHLRRKLVEAPPVAWHEWNTSTWLTLNYDVLQRLTGWNPSAKHDTEQRNDAGANASADSSTEERVNNPQQVNKGVGEPEPHPKPPETGQISKVSEIGKGAIPETGAGTTEATNTEVPVISDEDLEPLPAAEIASATLEDCNHNQAQLQTQFPSTYIENKIHSPKKTENSDVSEKKEILFQEKKILNTQENSENYQSTTTGNTSVTGFDQSSGADSLNPNNQTNKIPSADDSLNPNNQTRQIWQPSHHPYLKREFIEWRAKQMLASRYVPDLMAGVVAATCWCNKDLERADAAFAEFAKVWQLREQREVEAHARIEEKRALYMDLNAKAAASANQGQKRNQGLINRLNRRAAGEQT